MVRSAERDVIGRIGRVTGRIGAGLLGEITLADRGGSAAYLAYPADTRQRVLEIGEQALVVEASPPRVVWVAPLVLGQGQ